MQCFFQAERARKQAELQADEYREQLNEIAADHANDATMKRKLEAEVTVLKVSFSSFSFV